MLGDELEQFDVRIFATDLDADAIDFARRGRLPGRGARRTCRRTLIERYFTRIGDEYEVKKQVRALVGLRPARPRPARALPADRPGAVPQRADLLHAGTAAARAAAVRLLAARRRLPGAGQGGDRRARCPSTSLLEDPRLKIYRRQGDRVLIPPARIRDSRPLMPARAGVERRPAAMHRVRRSRAARGSRRAGATAGERADQLLLRLPEGVVVVIGATISNPSIPRRGGCWAFTARRSARTSSTWRRASPRPPCARRWIRPSAARATVTVFQVATADCRHVRDALSPG